jgi:hypothetical protein
VGGSAGSPRLTTTRGGSTTADGETPPIGTPGGPVLPVAPPNLPQPLPVPVPAPVAPAGPASATASGASACSSGHTEHPGMTLAVLDTGGASLLGGSSVRSSSGFAGAVVGGADDPGARPD